MRAAESVATRAHRAVADAELTVSQFGVLEAVFHLGPMCQKELGAKLLKSGGNITMVVRNLERRGLVKRVRSPENRRFVTVSLTEEGRRLIRRLFPVHVRAVVREMGDLSTAELERFGELCRRIGIVRPPAPRNHVAFEAQPLAGPPGRFGLRPLRPTSMLNVRASVIPTRGVGGLHAVPSQDPEERRRGRRGRRRPARGHRLHDGRSRRRAPRGDPPRDGGPRLEGRPGSRRPAHGSARPPSVARARMRTTAGSTRATRSRSRATTTRVTWASAASA
jgi:MarR family 2-MHQ and catechol resistance regulon transcriptional repressor